jgi:hypothetical protein
MSTQNNDIFTQRLDAMILELQKCQEIKNLESCSSCENYIGCEIRKKYVATVYDSMSKGQTGGFEF